MAAPLGPKIADHVEFRQIEFCKNDSVHFSTTPDASGVYPTLHGYSDSMQKIVASQTIQVTRADQSIWKFNDDPTKNTHVGSLMSVTATDGNVTEFVYNSSKQLDKIQTYHNSLPSRILETLEYTWNFDNRVGSNTGSKNCGSQ